MQSKILIFIIQFSFFTSLLFAQNEPLRLSKQEIEVLFLKNNLELLAENISVSMAEAEIIQAKVWPNPTISIEEVNLWRPKHIGNAELIPPIAGNFGKNQQFAIGFEQLILTAGKRKKLIELKKIGVEQQKQYFENILRNLKFELRQLIHQLEGLEKKKQLIESQLSATETLLNAYKNQVDKGFVNKGEAIRLNALALHLNYLKNELENESSEVEFDLKSLLQISPNQALQITVDQAIVAPLKDIQFNEEQLIEMAKNHRPDFQIVLLEESYAEQQLKVEKAERAPDFSILGEYNRGDGIYPDFVGFGISLDLPLFNRNKGGIKLANLAKEQAQISQQMTNQSISKEIYIALAKYRRAFAFLESIDENYEAELDVMLNAYTKNFQQKNLNIIEYLDFLEAYLDNKNILIDAFTDFSNKKEELNYAVGTDIFNP